MEEIHIFVAPNGLYSGNVLILIAKTLSLVICVCTGGIWFDESVHFLLQICFTGIILVGEEKRVSIKGNKVRLVLVKPEGIRMLSLHNKKSLKV